MESEDLIAPDLVLLLLHAPTKWPEAEGKINGITRLEKLLFLLEQELGQALNVSQPFTFEAYHYGPYSREIYEAVELLEEAGLLSEERSLTDSDLDRAEELLYSDMASEISYERRFELTKDGALVAGYLARKHGSLSDGIANLKDRYGGLSLQNLIYHVYTEYPDYTEKSVIRDKILRSNP
ncbi:hypothetical protein [Candidatus Poriferisodalis sp.]|uniref:hypothetical protein n=1 Tax=Candidatus Poriferisodalis sp. TaxID=3101277 RepID=UPI003B01599A